VLVLVVSLSVCLCLCLRSYVSSTPKHHSTTDHSTTPIAHFPHPESSIVSPNSSLPYPLSLPSVCVVFLFVSIFPLSPFVSLPPSFALAHPHAHLSLVRRLSYPGDYVPVHFPSQLSARLPMSSSSNGASGVSTPPSASSANANGLRSPPKITSMASKSLADSQRKQSSSPMDQTQRYVSHFVCCCPHSFCRLLFHCFSISIHPHHCLLVVSVIATFGATCESTSPRPIGPTYLAPTSSHLHHPFHPSKSFFYLSMHI
jgi:hypothetical protein